MNTKSEVEQLERENPTYRHNWLDRSDGPVYDTIYLQDLETGGAPSLFSQPVGTRTGAAGIYTKTDLDTNMYFAQILPPPWKMFVDEIRCLFTKGDVIIPFSSPWYRNTVFKFEINCRLYLDGHLDTIIDPSALFADEAERKRACERDLFKLLRHKISTPLLIETQQAFGCRVYFHNALDLQNGPDKLRIYLDGFRYREIV